VEVLFLQRKLEFGKRHVIFHLRRGNGSGCGRGSVAFPFRGGACFLSHSHPKSVLPRAQQVKDNEWKKHVSEKGVNQKNGSCLIDPNILTPC